MKLFARIKQSKVFKRFALMASAVVGQLTITNIAAILGICVASCIGLMLFWWGGRKVVRMIMAAFKKGQLKI